MILKGFKEKSVKKYLNKLLSEREVLISDNKVESLGVIINIDEVDDFELFKTLAKRLKLRENQLQIISFSERKKEDLLSWDDCYNPKDFGWNGKINNAGLETFLQRKFDLLVNYYEKEITELKLITALSQAKFKIGTLQADERVNDIIIKTGLKDFNLFTNEVVKYLTILNKIKTNEH